MSESKAIQIAVVSDDEALRDQLVDGLAPSFLAAGMTGSGPLLELLHGITPSAIVLDLELRGADAFDVLRTISSDPRLASVPVVALSPNGDATLLAQQPNPEGAEFLSRRIRPAELREKLREFTSGKPPRPGAARLRLGDMLVASGMLTTDQLHDALRRQRELGARLGEVLVGDGSLTEHQMVEMLARQMRLRMVDLGATVPQAAAMTLLPREFIVRHRVMPIRVADDGVLELAMTNPLDVITMDEVSMRVRRRVVPVICTQSGFDEAIAVYFSARGKLKEARDEADDTAEPSPSEVDAGAIEIVDALLTDATTMGASDIHIEPREDVLHVRCRIDGVLHDLRDFPKEAQAGILSRLKIMGNLDIAERRLPQDGRSTFELSSGETVDLRLASLPSLYGENITVRILEVSPLPPTLASLGLTGANLERFEQALRKPEGGVAIVGPTGSGKSTTLYTTLELTRSRERKVYTVEDPVERKIEGIVQIEIKPAIGLTFARALRSLVRADPDVIMVGEIRDLETAKMAADAAITGHKVFTTLHTNDASAAVARLIEMGVPRYLVAAAWDCFVAQRLTRRLCTHCRKPQEITGEQWRELGLGEPPKRRMTVYSPMGCGKCFGTGYRGRLGLYEVLVIDDELRDLIAGGGTVLDVQRAARAKGVGSLRDDGVRKVLDGSTSHLELLRVIV